MTLCAPSETDTARPALARHGASDGVVTQVRRILALAASPPVAAQRRREQRTPFPQLVRVQAVDPKSLVPQDEPLVVVGKFLSEHGLGFFHQASLPHRFVLVTLEVHGGPPARLLLDVSWCRFTRLGWYESGGRFLRSVD